MNVRKFYFKIKVSYISIIINLCTETVYYKYLSYETIILKRTYISLRTNLSLHRLSRTIHLVVLYIFEGSPLFLSIPYLFSVYFIQGTLSF